MKYFKTRLDLEHFIFEKLALWSEFGIRILTYFPFPIKFNLYLLCKWIDHCFSNCESLAGFK